MGFYKLLFNLKQKLGLYGGISLGTFLFILFFQPFPIRLSDLDNGLVFIAGFGVIIFIVLLVVAMIFQGLFQKQEEDLHHYVQGFSILVICSVAFAFYLRYVGQASITFHIMLKIVLICIAPPLLIRLFYLKNNLLEENRALQKENNSLKQQILKNETDTLNKIVEFISENNTENISLPVRTIAFIKSADNYVEIFYREDETSKKKLIRNTLKNIEYLVRPYSTFLRCHRTCIVNSQYIEKISRKINTHWLTIRDFKELVPVSRQYLLILKEAMAQRQG
jgi:DNA-binding LytR/AlgR family response regulator